jgi:hypothetical protein
MHYISWSSLCISNKIILYIGVPCAREHSFIFENADENEDPHVKRNRVNCPSFQFCVEWTIYKKNVTILVEDISSEGSYSCGGLIFQTSELLFCSLEDGYIFTPA